MTSPVVGAAAVADGLTVTSAAAVDAAAAAAAADVARFQRKGYIDDR